MVSRRPRAAGPRARDRRRLAPRARAGRRVRPAPRGAAQRAGLDVGHFPDSFTHSTLGGWIATRSSGMQSDKYGDIADLTRAVAGRHAGRACSSRGRCPRTRPARACARWCSAARAGSGSSPRRRCTCTGCPSERVILGYLFPDWARALAAMREHRRERGGAVGHPRVRRATRRSSPSPRKKAPTPVDRLKSRGAAGLSCGGGASFDLDADVPGVHRLRGQRGATSTRQRKLVGGSSSRHGGVCIGSRPGRALRPEEVRHARTSATTCSTAARSPTCRRPRRRGAPLPVLYDDVMAAARGAFAASACAAGSCATSRTRTTRARACTSRSRSSPSGAARPARAVRRRQGGDPAGVHRLRRDAVAPPRGRHGARARGSSRTSRRPASRCCARCSTAWTPARNLNPGKIVPSKTRGLA